MPFCNIGPRLVSKARPDIINKFAGSVQGAESVIPQYIYHCNAQSPTGEAAFHAMMASFGWAKFPMINRINALKTDVPVTFVYGARSWVDHNPGLQLKSMRQNVEVHVIQGAGHHVYADNYNDFHSIVNKACESVECGGDLDEVDKIIADYQK